MAIWAITTAMTMVLLVGLAVDLSGRVLAKQRAQTIAAEAARRRQPASACNRDPRSRRRRRPRTGRGHRAHLPSRRAPGITGDVSVHSGTRVVTNTETTYQTKFLSIIGITALTVTGHAEVDVNRAVEGVAQ